MSTLVERLQASAERLGQRSIAEMYQNPFWQERFGARGRQNADQDGQYHLSYLIQALSAGDPGVLTSYARWLQTLLVSRGMCSRHIAENFQRLAQAIRDEVEDSQPARELLELAVRALEYESGPARELQRLCGPLTDATVATLAEQQPAWFSAATSYTSLAAFESIADAERSRCKHDVSELFAYLADALHVQRPEIFASHALWLQGFLTRRQAPWADLGATLRGVDAALRGVSAELVAEVQPFLEAAQAQLAGDPEQVSRRPSRLPDKGAVE
jgi:hypothetical protein